jgi:hypothetical protein
MRQNKDILLMSFELKPDIVTELSQIIKEPWYGPVRFEAGIDLHNETIRYKVKIQKQGPYRYRISHTLVINQNTYEDESLISSGFEGWVVNKIFNKAGL